MALIFSCGGGKLGNQLLNIIHLNAFAFEYNIDIYKINDLYIKSKNKGFIYKIEKNKINWEIVSEHAKVKKFDKLFLKILGQRWQQMLGINIMIYTLNVTKVGVQMILL